MNDETKQAVSETIEETVKAAEETVRHPYTKTLARFGFYTNGLDGALLTLAQSYYGKVLLFIASIGLIAQGVLSLYEAHYRRIC
ncbi:MAG: DUF1206 domain-containing protein [Acidobacteria bacterium]|jgi:hypothetical protein|nr:DUF1206 domain-containing protein [Acidobacteriota bacterium]